MLDPATLDAFAREMLGIYRNHRLDRELDRPIADLSIADAYAVQDRVVALRVADGERHAGYKVGCTSNAIRRQFGLDQPIVGHLMAPAIYESGVRLAIDEFVDCAVEPEFVFQVERPIAGRGLSDDDLRAALAWPRPGLEVHNYRFFHGKATSQELIASNGIHAAQVVATNAVEARPSLDDFTSARVELLVDGGPRGSGTGGDILDAGPLASIRWLVEHLADRGRGLEAGEIVIPGSPVGLVRVARGARVQATIEDLGSCDAVFV